MDEINVMVSLQIPESTKSKLKEDAKKCGMTFSAYVRVALENIAKNPMSIQVNKNL